MTVVRVVLDGLGTSALAILGGLGCILARSNWVFARALPPVIPGGFVMVGAGARRPTPASRPSLPGGEMASHRALDARLRVRAPPWHPAAAGASILSARARAARILTASRANRSSHAGSRVQGFRPRQNRACPPTNRGMSTSTRLVPPWRHEPRRAAYLVASSIREPGTAHYPGEAIYLVPIGCSGPRVQDRSMQRQRRPRATGAPAGRRQQLAIPTDLPRVGTVKRPSRPTRRPRHCGVRPGAQVGSYPTVAGSTPASATIGCPLADSQSPRTTPSNPLCKCTVTG